MDHDGHIILCHVWARERLPHDACALRGAVLQDVLQVVLKGAAKVLRAAVRVHGVPDGALRAVLLLLPRASAR